MDMNAIFGLNAACASMLILSFGLPKQIWQCHKAENCSGISLVLLLSMFWGYVSWGVYGLVKSDPFILVPNTIAALMTAILLVQKYMYRKR